MIKEPESMREIHEIMEKLHKQKKDKSGVGDDLKAILATHHQIMAAISEGHRSTL